MAMAVACLPWLQRRGRITNLDADDTKVNAGSPSHCAAPTCHHVTGTAKRVTTESPSSIKQDTSQLAQSAGQQYSKAVSRCGANHAVRDSLIMSTTSEIITIVTLSGEDCIYQNPASVAWLGQYSATNTRRTSLESRPEESFGATPSEIGGGEGAAWPPARNGPFPLQDQNHNQGHHNHHPDVLSEIFSCEPEKLQSMLEELTRDQDARTNEWKGLVRMNVRKTVNTTAAAAAAGAINERAAGATSADIRTSPTAVSPFLSTSLPPLMQTPLGAAVTATAVTAGGAMASMVTATSTAPVDAEQPISPSAVSFRTFCSGGYGDEQLGDDNEPDGVEEHVAAAAGGGGGSRIGAVSSIAAQRRLRRRSMPALGQYSNPNNAEASFLLSSVPGVVLDLSDRLQLEAALNMSYGECAGTGGAAVGCRTNAGDGVHMMERTGMMAEDEVSERQALPAVVGAVVSETAASRRATNRGLGASIKNSIALPPSPEPPPQRQQMNAVLNCREAANVFVRTTPHNSNIDMDEGVGVGVDVGGGGGVGGEGPYGQGFRVLSNFIKRGSIMSYRRHSMDSIVGNLSALTPIPSSSALPSLTGIPCGENYDSNGGGSCFPSLLPVLDPEAAEATEATEATEAAMGLPLSDEYASVAAAEAIAPGVAVMTTRSLQLHDNGEMLYDIDDVSLTTKASPKRPPTWSPRHFQAAQDGLPGLSGSGIGPSLRSGLKTLLSRVLHRSTAGGYDGGCSSSDERSSSGGRLGSSAATMATAVEGSPGDCRKVYGDVRVSNSSLWSQRRLATEAIPAVLPETGQSRWLTLATGTAPAAAAVAAGPPMYSSASSMRATARPRVPCLRKTVSYNSGVMAVQPSPPPPPLNEFGVLRTSSRRLLSRALQQRRNVAGAGAVGSSMPTGVDVAAAAAAVTETEEVTTFTAGRIDGGGVGGRPSSLPYRPWSAVTAAPPQRSLGRTRSCRRVLSLPPDGFLGIHNSHLRAAAGGSGSGSSGISLSARTVSYSATTKPAAQIWVAQPTPMSMPLPLPLAMPLHAVTFAGSLRTAPPAAVFLTAGTTSLKRNPSIRVPTDSGFINSTARGGSGVSGGGGGGSTGLMGSPPMLGSQGSMSSIRSETRTEINPGSASAAFPLSRAAAAASCLTPSCTPLVVETALVSENSTTPTPATAPAPPFLPAVSASVVHGTDGVQEVWHEVWARRAVDPILGEDVIIVAQHDVTARVVSERHLALVMETEHRLLEQLYPRHILEGIVEYWTANCAAEDSFAAAAPPVPASGSVAATAAAAAVASSSFSRSWRPSVRDPYALATWHPEVTLLFADICGFTPLCKEMEPRAVMHMLNALFSRFDSQLDKCGVFKVETIGDCYFAAGGLVDTDQDGMTTVRSRRGSDDQRQHALEVFEFAHAMLSAAKEVIIPTTGRAVQIRIGLHTGPVVSGVVGTRMPRFCLFGDTVNTASRMESTGVPGAVHVSEVTYSQLKDLPGWVPTGGVEVKGKGHMKTYVNFCAVQDPIA
ncbi:hypothetical protein Vafri_17902 [Volvox africanus]|uniref:Guanylate cyclase domain-containing protein n=1 Tax=Volvox africanus TaxID=51714 RepID=A0A8J4BMY5_9CHLO|nr:hypothetical protein Vafri_17902 [Volvox africanus]